MEVKRQTGFVGMAAPIKIYANDQVVATIDHKESIKLKLPSKEAELTVKQMGMKSNKIHVTNQDKVLISQNPVAKFILPSQIVLILINAFGNVDSSIKLLANLMIISLFIAIFFINFFELSIVEDETIDVK